MAEEIILAINTLEDSREQQKILSLIVDDEDEKFTNYFRLKISKKTSGLFFLFIFIMLMTIFYQNADYLPYLIPLLVLMFVNRTTVNDDPDNYKISITRLVSRKKITEGESVEILFLITNNSQKNTLEFELKDIEPYKNGEKVQSGYSIIRGPKNASFIFNLWPKESITLRYIIQFDDLGLFEFDSVLLRRTDYLNFTYLESKTDANSLYCEILVIPYIYKIDQMPIKTQWLKLLNGHFISKFRGRDSDFQGIREYNYGDILNHINWKTSARFQSSGSHTLFTNTFSWDRAIDCEILLDATYSVRPIWNDNLRIFASIADFILKFRNSLGLLILNDTTKRIKPNMGKRHLNILITETLPLNPTPINDDDIYLNRLKKNSSKLKSNALIIVISPLLEPLISKYLIWLKKNGFNIIILVPKTINKQADSMVFLGDYKRPELHAILNPLLKIENLEQLNRLKRHGISTIEWDPDTHLGQLLKRNKSV